MPKFIDDPEAFLQVLSDAGVNQTTQQYIKDKGYDTIALVAFAIPENSIEEVVKHLSPVADGRSFEPFSPQVSCLRRALTRCVQYVRDEPASSSTDLGLTPAPKTGGRAPLVRLKSQSSRPVEWGAPPPLSSRPSNAANWGIPPALKDQPQTVASSIADSGLDAILKDLCLFQSLGPSMTIPELAQKITNAPWYEDLLRRLSESVMFLTGCPNSGKSTLVVNISQCLGLTKTRTTSKNFWLYSRGSRPYFSMWLFCTDSFYDGERFDWSRLDQSLNSKIRSEELKSGGIIVEGHRSLEYPSWGDVATSTAILSSTQPIVESRGTPAASIKKHKLYMSKLLHRLEGVSSYGILSASGSEVTLVCQSLQLMLLDDSNLNTAHMRADEIDGRWIF